MVRLLTFIIAVLVFPTAVLAQTPQSPAQESSECTQAKATVTRLEGRLKDWPALARYHDDNASTVVSGKTAGRVVFMGDSITDSWDDPKYGGFFPGKPYVNRGISGQTTPQMLIRFRPDVIDLKPKVVVILAGTNDLAGNTGPTTLEAIQANFISMAELARANGIRVVFASVLPVSDYELRDGKPIVPTAGGLRGWQRVDRDHRVRCESRWINGCCRCQRDFGGLGPSARVREQRAATTFLQLARQSRTLQFGCRRRQRRRRD